jgi:mono/diheme cytochrome c family protein
MPAKRHFPEQPSMGQIFVAIPLLLMLFATPSRAESQLERGRYLVETVAACGNCHTPKGPDGPLPDKKLAGGDIIKHADFTAATPNITPDRETGIGNWIAPQIFAAIREGRRPDGTLIGPAMPSRSYRDLADEDVEAIVAYLRSVPPVYNPISVKSHYDEPLPASWGPPVGQVVAPPKADKVVYGAYLAGPLARCMDCHTERRPGEPTRFGAGGKQFLGPWGISVSANLSSDKTNGLGDWSDAEIERTIRTGIARDGHKLFPPMPFPAYKNIAADDMAALLAYLRSLPAIE